MAKRYKYTFVLKKESEDGIFSTILAVASVVLFLVAAILSFVLKGKGGIYLGGIGLVAMLLSIYGFYRGLKSFSEPDKNHRLSIIGSLANGLVVVGWLGLFLIGVS